jgi:hypothetical protein
MELLSFDKCMSCCRCLKSCLDLSKKRVSKVFVDGKRRCAKCREYKEYAEFSENKSLTGGLSAYCKKCNREYQSARNIRLAVQGKNGKDLAYQKKYYIENKKKINEYKKDYVANNKQAESARYKFRYFCKKNNITPPDLCELCGMFGLRVHPHHDDYSKPLVVKWLCKSCHQKIHRQKD